MPAINTRYTPTIHRRRRSRRRSPTAGIRRTRRRCGTTPGPLGALGTGGSRRRGRGDLEQPVHPAEVVPLEVAEEHVATGRKTELEGCGGPRGHLRQLACGVESVLVHAEAVRREREGIGGQIGGDGGEPRG